MDKVTNLKKIIDAIDLILTFDFGIGKTGERKSACVGIKFFREYFDDLEWTIRRREDTKNNLVFDWAYIEFAGIEFGASVSQHDIEEHNAHLKAIKKQEAVA